MTEATLITSQSFIDDAIVSEKIASGDFEVQVSPVFEIDGSFYRVIQDGHHSFEAARLAGISPDFIEQTSRENDRIALLEAGNIDAFLEACWVDSDYRIAGTDLAAF